MGVFGLAGWSGSGKTTLVESLLPVLIGRGLTVSTVKHVHDGVDLLAPEDEVRALRMAGPNEILISSRGRWARMHEIGEGDDPSLEELMRQLTPVDLVIIEGFKSHGHDKLEVYREANGKPLLAPSDPSIVAMATDCGRPVGLSAERVLPIFDLNAIAAIADFIVARCGLEALVGAADRATAVFP